jgi:hypothetical protein
MLYREIIAVCSEIHTKHINTLCGQYVQFVNVKPVGSTVTTGLQRATYCHHHCDSRKSRTRTAMLRTSELYSTVLYFVYSKQLHVSW